jgi:uncharacterized protein (TIGR03067 family)
MKNSMFGAAALVTALLVTGGAVAQQKQAPPPARPNTKQAGAKQKQAGPAARPKAQGETTVWRITSLINDGKDASAAVKNHPLALNGKTFALSVGNKKVLTGTFTSNDRKKLKEFDAVSKAGSGKGIRLQGIYQRKGDTLELCFAPAGKPRPTAFTAKKGSGNRLFVLKHVPAEQTAKGQPGRPASPGAKGPASRSFIAVPDGSPVIDRDGQGIKAAAANGALTPAQIRGILEQLQQAQQNGSAGTVLQNIASEFPGISIVKAGEDFGQFLQEANEALNAPGKPGNQAPGAAARAASQQKDM